MPFYNEEFKTRARKTAKFLKEYDGLAVAEVNARKAKLVPQSIRCSLTDTQKCVELLTDLQANCDRFFYHIIAWLDRMENVNSNGTITSLYTLTQL